MKEEGFSRCNLKEIRKEFPITEIAFEVIGRSEPVPLIYFDHAASTHPPRQVLKTYIDFLENDYANIHRGHHNLSLIASKMFDRAKEVIAEFIGGHLSDHAIIMTGNTTEALTLASHVMTKMEGITLATWMEHHSNDLPHRKRGKVEYVELLKDGSLDMADLEGKLKKFQVKLVAVTGASNVTGFMPDIQTIARMAHENGAYILVDAAQLLAHHKIDVGKTGIDFLAAAGHKTYAPFGSAFLYAPRELLDKADPCLPGGGTIVYVTHDDVLYEKSPERHEGGTPNIAGAIGFAESLKFLDEIGMARIRQHEKNLLKLALEGLLSIEGVTVYGPLDPEKRLGVIAFNILDLPHDLVSAILNYEGAIATRNGCFCAHPYLHKLLKVKDLSKLKTTAAEGNKHSLPGTVRASFGIYNTEEEVEEFLKMIRLICEKKWIGEYRFAPSGACNYSLPQKMFDH